MATKGELAIGTVPLPEHPIRITIPAKVAWDLKAMQTVLGKLAERLGCTACLSGVDCRFQLEREFLVDPQSLNLEGVSGGRFGR